MRYKGYALILTAVFLLLSFSFYGCADLGEFDDLEHYHNAIGDIILISDPENSGGKSYSVKDYFYNENSQDEFLVDENGVYKGVDLEEYIYMAIPMNEDVIIDELSLYMFSETKRSVYISCYIVDELPTIIRGMGDSLTEAVEESPGAAEGDETSEPVVIEYDDPDPEESIFNTVVHLTEYEWDSFTVSSFELVKGEPSKTCELLENKIFLIQFRNNSGIDSEEGNSESKVDSVTGEVVEKASFTMTNLMIRAVETVEKEGN